MSSDALMSVATFKLNARKMFLASRTSKHEKRRYMCIIRTVKTSRHDPHNGNGGHVELLGSPYYKGVPLPRIPSVSKPGMKSPIAKQTEPAHPLDHEVCIPTRADQPLSPKSNTVDPLDQHNMRPRSGFRESGKY